jgi:hypothetical protein
MGGGTLGAGSSGRLLTLGHLDRVSVQVGYRTRPDGPPYVQFLLDLAVPEPDPAGAQALVDEALVLAALERTLHAGGTTARHYSLHQHRWHTSWGPSPGVLEVGLLVTTGTRPAGGPDATPGVTAAFTDLMDTIGWPAPAPILHDAALLRARRAVAAAYAVDPGALSPRTGQHLDGSWRIGLRAPTGEGYDVVVGLVSGYVGSVLVRRDERTDVVDSVGTE